MLINPNLTKKASLISVFNKFLDLSSDILN
nr:MAG TPA: hypothetical protein [Caudoviricetes sp.]